LALLQGDAFAAYPNAIKSAEDTNKTSSNLHRNRTGYFDFRATLLKYPLLDYAVKKWHYHANHYHVEDNQFSKALEQFCDPKSCHFKAYLKLLSSDDTLAKSKVTHLHVAAAFGLLPWANHLIKNGASLDALDSSGNSPLFWAARGGHTEVSKVLLGSNIVKSTALLVLSNNEDIHTWI